MVPAWNVDMVIGRSASVILERHGEHRNHQNHPRNSELGACFEQNFQGNALTVKNTCQRRGSVLSGLQVPTLNRGISPHDFSFPRTLLSRNVSFLPCMPHFIPSAPLNTSSPPSHVDRNFHTLFLALNDLRLCVYNIQIILDDPVHPSDLFLYLSLILILYSCNWIGVD